LVRCGARQRAAKNPKQMITLGQKYTDRITGFKGTATSRTIYISGCVHIGLQGPVDKDGKLPAAEFFDEERLDPKSTVKTGGPAAHPKFTRPD
jgi:hypothetical protein